MRVRIFVQEPSLPGRPGVFRAEVDQFAYPTRVGFGFSPAEAEADGIKSRPWGPSSRSPRLIIAAREFFGYIPVFLQDDF